MANKIPVSAIFPYLKKMLDDKWGYIYGTAGKLWTRQLQDNATNDMAIKYGEKWIGHMVTDCSGVMVYIWKQFGLSIPHGSNSMVKKGYVETPLYQEPKPGYAAFKYKWNTNDYYHIGIVGEDGETVYEAKSTAKGFTTSKTNTWDLFAPFTQVDYTESEETIKMESYFAVITGDKVRVRSGPGVNYSKISEVNTGDMIQVIGVSENGKWAQAKIGDLEGYVYSQYVEKIEHVITTPAVDDVEEGVFIPADLANQLYEILKEGLGK